MVAIEDSAVIHAIGIINCDTNKLEKIKISGNLYVDFQNPRLQLSNPSSTHPLSDIKNISLTDNNGDWSFETEFSIPNEFDGANSSLCKSNIQVIIHYIDSNDNEVKRIFTVKLQCNDCSECECLDENESIPLTVYEVQGDNTLRQLEDEEELQRDKTYEFKVGTNYLSSTHPCYNYQWKIESNGNSRGWSAIGSEIESENNNHDFYRVSIPSDEIPSGSDSPIKVEIKISINDDDLHCDSLVDSHNYDLVCYSESEQTMTWNVINGNSVDEFPECFESGETYRIKVTNDIFDDELSYNWTLVDRDTGDVVDGFDEDTTENIIDVPIPANTGTLNLVVTTMKNGCQIKDSRDLVICVTPSDGDDSTTSTGTTLCKIWFWINIALVFAISISVLALFCIIPLIAVAPPLGIVFISLLTFVSFLISIFVISFPLWIKFCLYGSMKNNICDRLEEFQLLLLLTELAMIGIAVVVMILMQDLACVIGLIIDSIWLTILAGIIVVIQRLNGCSILPRDSLIVDLLNIILRR